MRGSSLGDSRDFSRVTDRVVQVCAMLAATIPLRWSCHRREEASRLVTPSMACMTSGVRCFFISVRISFALSPAAAPCLMTSTRGRGQPEPMLLQSGPWARHAQQPSLLLHSCSGGWYPTRPFNITKLPPQDNFICFRRTLFSRRPRALDVGTADIFESRYACPVAAQKDCCCVLAFLRVSCHTSAIRAHGFQLSSGD